MRIRGTITITLPNADSYLSWAIPGLRRKTHRPRLRRTNTKNARPTHRCGHGTWHIAGSKQRTRSYAPGRGTVADPTLAPGALAITTRPHPPAEEPTGPDHYPGRKHAPPTGLGSNRGPTAGIACIHRTSLIPHTMTLMRISFINGLRTRGGRGTTEGEVEAGIKTPTHLR